jgi:hypothetical protein
MADLFRRAAEWLAEQQHAHTSRLVSYGRGAARVQVRATIGRTEFELDAGGPVLERIESRDYLIRARDLVLATGRITPARGDRIRELEGSTVRVFEVAAPGRRPVYRQADPYGELLRIHTNQVDSE